MSDSHHASKWPYDFPVDGQGFIQLNPEPGANPTPSDLTTGYMTDYLLTAILLPMSGPTNLPYTAETQADLTQNANQYQKNPAQWTAMFSPVPPQQPLTFKVIRHPVATSAAPLRLDSRAAIDLAFSGSDTGDPSTSSAASDTLSFQSVQTGTPPVSDTTPITILFSPSGELISTWVANTEWLYRNPIYLLIGRRDRVSLIAPLSPPVPAAPTGISPAEDGLWNWQDANNVWVTIKPSTGLVTTSEVKVPQTTDPFGGTWKDSRGYAGQAQTMGGR